MSESLKEKLRRFVLGRQHAYRQVFKGPYAQDVLSDLALFCRANASTFDPDARLHAVAEGRREVWLRLQNHLNLTPAELWALTSGGQD